MLPALSSRADWVAKPALKITCPNFAHIFFANLGITMFITANFLNCRQLTVVKDTLDQYAAKIPKIDW